MMHGPMNVKHFWNLFWIFPYWNENALR